MILFPNCKINLGLDILRRRPDGFHEIETLMVPVKGFTDGLEIIKSEGSDACFTTSGLPTGCLPEQNIVMKAYALMKSRFPSVGCLKVHLHKAVPSGAGLGGGSADAAFMLKGLNSIWGGGLSESELEMLAAKLGSDVPFFIRNVPQLCSGRGEVMEPVETNAALYGKYVVIVTPSFPVSTAEAYSLIIPRVPESPLRERIRLPFGQWRNVVANAFEEPLFRKYPVLAGIKQRLYDTGASYASMSGSGSAVFGIFDSKPAKLPTFSDCTVFTGRL